MKSNHKKTSPEESPPDWKMALCASFETLEETFPEPHWMKGEWPPWAQKAMQEILKACLPDARLKLGPSWTPRELGAVLGAKAGLLKWLGDENGFVKSKAAGILGNAYANLTKEQKAAADAEGGKLADGMVKYLEAFESVQTGALALGGTAETDEQKEFFGAYVDAMERAEKGLDVGTYGTTATPIYIFLVQNWRSVERVPTVAILHKGCGRYLGAKLVGELKTFQKLCQRIGLKLHSRGRPRNKR